MKPHRAPESNAGRPARRCYRFGFILNTAVGNMTRYRNLRMFAEKDRDVEFIWAPIGGYPPPSVARRFRFFPHLWVARAWVLWQMLPILRRLGGLDAVMIHLFEAEMICAARASIFNRPLIVSSTDEAPIVDEGNYPLYQHQKAKSQVRRAIRLRLDLWRLRRIDFFIPFTAWVGRILKDDCGVPCERVAPVHVGLDLSRWTLPAARRLRRPERRFQLLFVGGEFVRKGGDLLLSVFSERFAEVADLHLVSPQAPLTLPENVYAHRDLEPTGAQLLRLYAECDALVVPTTADLAPWVFIEGMAMECPVIGTDIGAIPELIEDGVTGFIVPRGDAMALGDRIGRLVDDPQLQLRMGREGRLRVERHYDASRNVPHILGLMKSWVDARA